MLKEVTPFFRGIYQVNEFNDNNGNKYFQLVRFSSMRKSGVEIECVEKKENKRKDFDNITEDLGKSNESLSRVKRMIYEYSYCNKWDWFFTATLNPKKNDVFDVDIFHKRITTFIKNYNFRHKTRIKFLFIPEKHKSGAWHIHGLLQGLPENHLELFTLNDYIPYSLLKKIKRGEKIYHWKSYEKHFGFCDLERIRNHSALAKYITKYVTKDLDNGISESGKHVYFCSRGLNKKKVLGKGFMNGYHKKPTYSTDYVSVWDNLEEEEVKNILDTLSLDYRHTME